MAPFLYSCPRVRKGRRYIVKFPLNVLHDMPYVDDIKFRLGNGVLGEENAVQRRKREKSANNNKE